MSASSSIRVPSGTVAALLAHLDANGTPAHACIGSDCPYCHDDANIAARAVLDDLAERTAGAMALDNDPFADKPTPEPGDSL